MFASFYSLSLFFDSRPIWSQLVLASLVWSRSVLCQSQWVSFWSSQGLPGPFLEEYRKKKKPTRSYTLRNEKCNM